MGVASFPWAASSADGLMSLKVGGVLGYLVRGSRLGGEGGFTLPRQEDGLLEALVEDSSGWMALGSMDMLVMVSGKMGCLFVI